MSNDSFLSDYLSKGDAGHSQGRGVRPNTSSGRSYQSVMRDTAQPMVWMEEVEPLPSSNLMDESSEIDEAFSRPIIMKGGQEACQEAIRNFSFWALLCRPWSSIHWKWVFCLGAIV